MAQAGYVSCHPADSVSTASGNIERRELQLNEMEMDM